jgi:hypothetical protein
MVEAGHQKSLSPSLSLIQLLSSKQLTMFFPLPNHYRGHRLMRDQVGPARTSIPLGAWNPQQNPVEDFPTECSELGH